LPERLQVVSITLSYKRLVGLNTRVIGATFLLE
jgi:hypothetical protein